MKCKKMMAGICSMLTALIMMVSPALAQEDQLIVVGSIAPNDRIDIFADTQLSESADQEDPGFQIMNQSLDLCLKENGLTWKEWDALSRQSRQKGTQTSVSLQELTEADPQAEVFRGTEGIYMITGKSLPLTAADLESAFCTAYRLLLLLERNADTDLILRSVISEGNARLGSMEKIYLFQEFRGGKTVQGSTLRLVTDGDGRVKAVFNSLYAGDPLKQDVSAAETEPSEAVMADAQAAEQIVLRYLEDTGIAATLLFDFTSQIIVLPEETEDGEAVMETDEDVPEELRWVVYSESMDGTYLAHYLSADGTYLYHQKVKAPGDEAGQSGSDTAYFFDRMEMSEYTGEVTYLTGETRSLTVPVMKDPDTGMYYLGDAQRRIVFADFYDYAYNDEELTLVSSADNTGWEETDLITFETFLKVWDFYAGLGWKSGDGLGTPILMLHDMTLENGTPMDNAAFGTIYKDWVLFAYDNSGVNFQEGLDVWTHEFTHAVTTTLQGYNLYQNDQGAINESMSDIMGNLCQIKETESNDRNWYLGENTSMIIRSMMNPHAYAQPEYVWDLYYGTDTTRPNDINDRGGVHSNSSILCFLAARLCEEYGMPPATARDFWLRLACMLTPMTDLPQIADVLEWVVQTHETETWLGAVRQLIESGQFRRVNAPTVLEEGRKMVLLELPDTPVMQDEYWILMAFQTGDLSDILGLVMEHLFSDDPAGESPEESYEGDIEDIILSQLVKQYTSWTNGENQNIYIQLEDKPALYILLNMDPDTLDPMGAALYLNGKWHDIGQGLAEIMAMPENGEPAEESEPYSEEEALAAVTDMLLKLVKEFLPIIFDTENTGEIITEETTVILPSNGLEEIELLAPRSEGNQ